MINIADLQAFIAFAVKNNKQGLIQAMNSSGYPVSPNISDAYLFNEVAKVGDKSIKRLKNVLAKVTIDTSKLTEQQARNLAIKYKDFNPNAKWNWNNIGQSIGDFLSGTTVVNSNPNITTQTSTPVLPAWVVPTTAIAGMSIIAFLFARNVKNALGASIAIGIVTIGVILYGTFAKKESIASSGGGGIQTVHNGALGWLDGILDGLHLSIAG